MEKLYKPDVDTILQPLLDEGTKGGQKTREEWLAGYASGLADHLRKNPKQYRSYGPYWWIVKRVLIQKGVEDFGEYLDQEWLEKTTYNDDVWDMLAGYAYGEYAVQAGLVYSHTHLIAYVNEDGDFDEDQYVLFDEDMEGMI